MPATHMRCVLERFHNDLRYLWMPQKTLKAEGFFKSNKVIITNRIIIRMIYCKTGYLLPSNFPKYLKIKCSSPLNSLCQVIFSWVTKFECVVIM